MKDGNVSTSVLFFLPPDDWNIEFRFRRNELDFLSIHLRKHAAIFVSWRKCIPSINIYQNHVLHTLQGILKDVLFSSDNEF